MSSFNINAVPETLQVSIVDGLATVALNRPEAQNALDQAQRLALNELFTQLGQNPDVRVIILKGTGETFCKGQDAVESSSMDERSAAARIEAYWQLYATLRRVSKPIIAEIRGVAAGAGLQLALLSDLRIASANIRIGMPELNGGSVPIFASALLLPIIGEAEMKKLVLMSELITASEALKIGLVHEVVDDSNLESRVLEIARTLANKPPLAVKITKEWWSEISEDLFQKTLAHAHEGHARNFSSGDFQEGARRSLGGR